MATKYQKLIQIEEEKAQLLDNEIREHQGLLKEKQEIIEQNKELIKEVLPDILSETQARQKSPN